MSEFVIIPASYLLSADNIQLREYSHNKHLWTLLDQVRPENTQLSRSLKEHPRLLPPWILSFLGSRQISLGLYPFLNTFVIVLYRLQSCLVTAKWIVVWQLFWKMIAIDNIPGESVLRSWLSKWPQILSRYDDFSFKLQRRFGLTEKLDS